MLLGLHNDVLLILDYNIFYVLWEQLIYSILAVISLQFLDAQDHCCLEDARPLGFTEQFEEVGDFAAR